LLGELLSIFSESFSPLCIFIYEEGKNARNYPCSKNTNTWMRKMTVVESPGRLEIIFAFASEKTRRITFKLEEYK